MNKKLRVTKNICHGCGEVFYYKQPSLFCSRSCRAEHIKLNGPSEHARIFAHLDNKVKKFNKNYTLLEYEEGGRQE